MDCREPGCSGVVEDGYCNECGIAPPRAAAVSVPASRATTSSGTGTSHTTGHTAAAARHKLGAGLVEIPQVAEHDPEAAILVDPHIPEEKRFCTNASCGAPVGRGREGLPGRTEGFCSRCGERFSFRPNLSPGDLVGGQYEVVGCIAHGGLGWIHLTRDLHLHGKRVVLKGLLNTNDPDALAAAIAEARFLAEIDHYNIVRIMNVVEHGHEAYIVMEYVPGTSLGAVLDNRRVANGGTPDPLPVTHAIAYMLDILPAFAYLHGIGLLYCDFKPDNVMQTGRAVKLIDLGGAQRMDDPTSAIYGTPGYQAPEIAETGPTVASDLFTVGRTLAVLSTAFTGYQHQYKYTLPDPNAEPLYARHDSLYRFLVRATALDPGDRFRDADEMASQLFGVLRDVVASETGTTTSASSELFTPELKSSTDRPDWRALPALLVSTDDPSAGFLASLPAANVDDVDEAIVLLAGAPEPSVEVQLRHARLLLDAGRTDDADDVLAPVAARDPREWRVAWYRGLARLQEGDAAAAIPAFETVYHAVPGELAPKLALGCAHESAEDFGAAAHWYDVVSRTDAAFTLASFGLARCRLASGDVAGAVRAYERVPERSSAFLAAQVAKAEAMLDVAASHSRQDLTDAAVVVDRLQDGSEEHTRLSVRLLEVALEVVRRDGDDPAAKSVLGCAYTETSIRFGLEEAYRTLARFTSSASKRIALIDRANAARPRTLV